MFFNDVGKKSFFTVLVKDIDSLYPSVVGIYEGKFPINFKLSHPANILELFCNKVAFFKISYDTSIFDTPQNIPFVLVTLLGICPVTTKELDTLTIYDSFISLCLVTKNASVRLTVSAVLLPNSSVKFIDCL